MQTFTNPLDKIKIASPCDGDWNEMVGNERRRFCSLCELNVYNLSNMTRAEAETFLLNSEDRVCLQVFRRADGTLITKDCPVGWAKIKRKVSRSAAAVFSLIAGFFGGVFAFESLKPLRGVINQNNFPETIVPIKKEKDLKKSDIPKEKISFGGAISNLTEIKNEILKSQDV